MSFILMTAIKCFTQFWVCLSVSEEADMECRHVGNTVCHHNGSIKGNEKYSWVIKATYSCNGELAIATKHCYLFTIKVTTPQDASTRLVLQVYLDLNT